MKGGGKIQLNQIKISQYLTSQKEGGGGEGNKVLGSKPRHTSLMRSGCSPRRASFGARREAGRNTTPKPPVCTPGREGRVTLGEAKGEKKGFGPWARWMSASGSRTEGPSKVKEGKGKGRGRTSLDPRVKSIKEYKGEV